MENLNSYQFTTLSDISNLSFLFNLVCTPCTLNFAFHWISVIRVPDFVSEKDFDWAVKMATNKKKIDCSSAEFITIEEGLCVQIMHIGPFDEEPKSVAIMDEFLEENGYVNDINEERLHHEIYLSDARKIPADKWKTIIRHPIKKAE